MKKIYSIILLLATLGFLWSCQEDEKVVMQKPGSFVLNVPKYVTGIYDLKNMETIEFSTSQPGYGFTAAATYSVEISLSESFSEFAAIPGTYTTAKFDVQAADVALIWIYSCCHLQC